METCPITCKRLADENVALLRTNPHHPALHFKQAARFCSVRVGRSWQALGVADGDDIVWFWIGSHADYDKLVK